MAKKLFDYDFETDDIEPTYKLTIHVRDKLFRNEYITKTFTRSLRKSAELANNDNEGDISAFFDKTDRVVIPEKYFNNINTACNKTFKDIKKGLEKKHVIVFLTWRVVQAVFYRNAKDKQEWIMSVVYEGEYDD